MGSLDNLRSTLRHGHSRRGHRTPTYTSWHSMKRRCEEPGNKAYPAYGGRGVTICARWHSFDAFLADMGERPPGTQLDRIDGRGNYEPGNCRWITSRENNRNRLNNHWITWNGRSMVLAAWAEETGIRPKDIMRRIRDYGWPVARALTERPRAGRRSPSWR